jgi:hypothetical protein
MGTERPACCSDSSACPHNREYVHLYLRYITKHILFLLLSTYCHVLPGNATNNSWVLHLILDLLDILQTKLQLIITVSTVRNYNRDNTLNASVTYLLTYGAESSLRSCQLCSPSRTPQDFMEPEGSIPCSQLVPILSHINPIHSIPSYLSKVHFNFFLYLNI